jgi:hypothetical protein
VNKRIELGDKEEEEEEEEFRSPEEAGVTKVSVCRTS